MTVIEHEGMTLVGEAPHLIGRRHRAGVLGHDPTTHSHSGVPSRVEHSHRA